MKRTIYHLQKGDKSLITALDLDKIPMKLIEFGCLPGSEVEILEKSILGCPIYLRIGDVRLAIRAEVAQLIEVEPLNNAHYANH